MHWQSWTLSCVWGVLQTRAIHSFNAVFQLVLLCMVTNITLIQWNNVKYQMKTVFQVQFATNQVTSGVKILKETLTHQVEAVWFLPKTFLENKNCTKSPQIFSNMPQFKTEYTPEMQALLWQDLRTCVSSPLSSQTWICSSGASPHADSPVLFWMTGRCTVPQMMLSGTTVWGRGDDSLP